MTTRLLSLLLLGSAILTPATTPAGTVTLIVPTYDYTPGKAENTEGYGIANNGTAVGQYNHKGTYGSFIRSQNGRFSRPILFPGAKSTDVLGVNTSGLVCGSFLVNVRGTSLDNKRAGSTDRRRKTSTCITASSLTAPPTHSLTSRIRITPTSRA